jgi:hypothetical protein
VIVKNVNADDNPEWLVFPTGGGLDDITRKNIQYNWIKIVSEVT